MIEITPDGLAPLVQKAAEIRGVGMVEAPVGILAPDEIAEAVAVVQKPRLKDLLVKPCAVEAERHRQLNIANQRGLGGRGVNSVGVEALVEDEPLEDRFFVDEKFFAVEPHAPQPEVTFHFIAAEGQSDAVKPPFSDLPEVFFGQRYLYCQGSAVRFSEAAADGFSVVSNLGAKPAETA